MQKAGAKRLCTNDDWQELQLPPCPVLLLLEQVDTHLLPEQPRDDIIIISREEEQYMPAIRPQMMPVTKSEIFLM